MLKTAFERHKLMCNPAYLTMGDDEEDKIKSVIWDPTIPEAALLIQAFKIDGEEVANVFSAWKGVSFYQYQFEINKPLIAEIIWWLKSENATPTDHREHVAFPPQQEIFKQQVLKKH